jgi:hypothetical protein
MIPANTIQAFQASTFEKVGLQGPPTGISLLDWSFDSLYLATRCDSMPTAVWIWDMTTFDLHTVLIQLNPVKTFKFAPHSQ